MLEAARPLVTTETQHSAFNASVEDWNSRCGSYQYRESDKSAIDGEVADQRATLEARGRAFAGKWESAPTFSQSSLTIDTLNGQRPRNFVVELARTPKEWGWGTSFRTSMPPNGGMLYIYPAPQVLNQTMLTAYFSLDVLFIDERGVIFQIFSSRPPRSSDPVNSKSPGKAMLEINGGAVDRLGIKVGDAIHSPAFVGAVSRTN